MPIARVTDHVTAGLALLTQQYQDKPRLAGLVTSYLNRVQELEDAIWSSLIGRLIDNAVGVQLDTLGRIVGQPRSGAMDEPYRARIRARIRANRSNGRPDDILSISITCTGLAPEDVTLAERGYASYTVSLAAAVDYDVAAVLRDLLELASPLGVAFALKFSDYDSGETFAFASGDSPTTNAARGFAATDSPTTAPGGRWIDVL